MLLRALIRSLACCIALGSGAALPAQSVTVRLDSVTADRDTRVLAWLVNQHGRSAGARLLAGRDEHTLAARQAGPHALCARRVDGFTFGTPWFELREGEQFQLDPLVRTDSASITDQPICRSSEVPAGVVVLASAEESAPPAARGVRVRVLDGATYAPVRGAQLAIRLEGASEAAGATGDSAGQVVIASLPLRNDGSVLVSLRALGYQPRFMTLPARALRSADSVIVLLSSLAQRLAGMRVEGDRPLPRGLDRRTMLGWTVSDKVMREVRPFARNVGDFVRRQGLAGVRVQGETCVRIRNHGCAVVVVDGIPRDPRNFYIDPVMIEQIVVLRPTDASTLYGRQGVNGAVVVTTSTGERREERR